MPLHDAIYSHLSGYAGLTALVSTRIYPIYRAQDSALPAVTFLKVAGTSLNVWQGVCGERIRIQISVWAETVRTANSVSAQVRAAMTTFQGVFSDVTVRSTDFLGDQDLYDTDPDGNKGTAHQALEFEVFVA